MFVTLFTVQLFSYFGALIFPLSCSAGSRSSFSLPAAATSLLSFREELFRPKYLPIESTEHLEFIENHFYFIKPMIDTEVFIFATTEVAEYPFYGSNNLFSHWQFLFLRSSLCSTISLSSSGQDSHSQICYRVSCCPHKCLDAPHFTHILWMDFQNGIYFSGTSSKFLFLRFSHHSDQGDTPIFRHDTFLHVQPRRFENPADVCPPSCTCHPPGKVQCQLLWGRQQAVLCSTRAALNFAVHL